jgi:hypothetical protein
VALGSIERRAPRLRPVSARPAPVPSAQPSQAAKPPPAASARRSPRRRDEPRQAGDHAGNACAPTASPSRPPPPSRSSRRWPNRKSRSSAAATTWRPGRGFIRDRPASFRPGPRVTIRPSFDPAPPPVPRRGGPVGGTWATSRDQFEQFRRSHAERHRALRHEGGARAGPHRQADAPPRVHRL